ncbi:MAG: sensor histidine kinase, partial [Armatimonadota bacterium]
ARDAIRSPDVLALFEAALEAEAGGEVAKEITGPGDGRIYQGQTTLMRDADGEPQAAVGIFNDITEIRQVERMKTTFVSTVSHELRTPLTSIKGFITTLMDDTDNMYDHQTRMEFYEIINQECDRLTRLINDLLNVSRIEAGRGIDLQLSEVDLYRIAEQVRELEQGYTDQHDIINDLPEDFPTIIADADKVTRILENIVSNAIRYSPSGGQVIMSGRDEGDTVVIDISDEGLGIPEAHRSKIFQRFHVIDNDEGRETIKGTGIGLYLVQHLARAHGEEADVWLAHSEVGEGSTFSVRLPKEPQLEGSEE